jgi:hypothetical protein
MDCRWDAIEKKKGVYTTAVVVARASSEVLAAGLIPMVLIGWTPSFWRQAGTDRENSAPRRSGVVRNVRTPSCARSSPRSTRSASAGTRSGTSRTSCSCSRCRPAVWADMRARGPQRRLDISRHIVIVRAASAPGEHRADLDGASAVLRRGAGASNRTSSSSWTRWASTPTPGTTTSCSRGSSGREHVTYLQTLMPATSRCAGPSTAGSPARTPSPSAPCCTWTLCSPSRTSARRCSSSRFDFAELYGILKADFTPKPVYDALKSLLA